jgi:hypothetical protein
LTPGDADVQSDPKRRRPLHLQGLAQPQRVQSPGAKMSKNVKKLSKMSKNCQNVKKLSKMSKNCQKCQKIVKNVKKLSKMSTVKLAKTFKIIVVLSIEQNG